MNIHEYQAKELLRSFDVPVPHGVMVSSAEEAGGKTYDEFVKKGTGVVVLKSQIHAGGRGKGHFVNTETREAIEMDGKALRGVNVIHSGNISDTVYKYAKAMHNNTLVTIQTGEEGKVVSRFLIEEGLDIAQEFYLSILLDRATSRNIVMASTEGGVEIETVAEETPEKILKETIDPAIGWQGYQARRLAFNLGLSGLAFKNFVKFIGKLVHAYESMDCSMLEINPLVRTGDDRIVALDAKVNFDDNALFRHASFEELRDLNEEEPLEIEAAKYDLNYIKLDGNVGCMVNGAGLAMGTMDIIKLAGGDPANFLDVGGGANAQTVEAGFRIILKDPNVKAILINIFGGIVRCDRVANGVVEAAKKVEINVPLIVRLQGTNAEEGQKILDESDLEVQTAILLKEAAQKVTQALA